ncbi:hypothetical protein [Lactococcus lactis]|uniref:Uncharacterized protein n=1 Tax=Lactococcus lactis TaxID=1358 RepID=A0A9X4NHA6_9LACT|nr:hypothetical protein [Lactococcus lactis]KSU00827.1 hypothetical protein KF201_1876 [Lactococcus lactis subsp. lactis]MCT1191564.1 hypothetical protein [Lactococcus lactis]MDG4984088.1 hypothetical protein [Lactococcus lactis]
MSIPDSAEVFEIWASSEIIDRYLTCAPQSSPEVTKEYLSFEEKDRHEGWEIVLKNSNQLIINIATINYAEKL